MLSLNKLSNQVLNNRQNFIDFCQNNKIIPKTKHCPECWGEMKFYANLPNNGNLGQFKCTKKCCIGKPGITMSISNDTWFSYSKLKPEMILIFTFCFANNMKTYEDLRRECNLYLPNLAGHLKQISDQTISSELLKSLTLI